MLFDSNAGKSCHAALFVVLAMLNSVTAADRSGREIPAAPTTQERFLKLIDRPRVSLESQEAAPVVEAGFLEQRFSYRAESEQRVPGLLVKLDSQHDASAVVIVLHGTGGGKDALRPLLRRIANQKLIAVAIDARYCGERIGWGKGTDSYRAAIFDTWQSGKEFPFLYDTVWDTLRLIDYLEGRPDVDAKRIGGLGISKGGTELYLAAAVDPRIDAIVPCIGVQSFGWALDHNAWQSRIGTIQSAVDSAAQESNHKQLDSRFIRQFYERVVPGIHQEFDGPAMLPLIAPRPVLVINGDRDDRTPRPGLERCVQAARAAYESAGAAKNFEFILQPDTGHAITPKPETYAIEWLTRQLAR
jgi:dienelactone hydrolase